MDNSTIYIDKIQFSKRLHELFKISNCKSIELENRLRVGRATVSRWRNGHTLPTNSQIKEIAQFFGVRYEWLIGRDPYRTIKDIPFKNLITLSARREKYLELLGYEIKPDQFLYEIDENGNSNISGCNYIISKGGISKKVSNDDLISIEKEIESFIDYKMAQLFNK